MSTCPDILTEGDIVEIDDRSSAAETSAEAVVGRSVSPPPLPERSLVRTAAATRPDDGGKATPEVAPSRTARIATWMLTAVFFLVALSSSGWHSLVGGSVRLRTHLRAAAEHLRVEWERANARALARTRRTRAQIERPIERCSVGVADVDQQGTKH